MSLFGQKGGRKKTTNYFVAIDAGTDLVKCLVFSKTADAPASILGKSVVPHAPGSMRGGMIINIPEAAVTFKTAVSEAAHQANVKPSNLLMSMPGDLTKSLVTTVHYHRAQPESHIDSGELKNIIYKVQLKAYEQMRQLMAKEQEEGSLDVKLINTTVVDMRVDGYKIDNPLGFQGGTVTLSIFNVFAPLVHLGALQAIADELELDLVSVAAGPYALTRCLTAHEENLNGIFIDVGAQTTDLVVMSEGGIAGIQNFAMGGNAFSRALATELKLSEDKAEQTKIDYCNDLLDKKSLAKLQPIMQTTALMWARGVAQGLREFTHLDVLPNRIFIGGGGATLPEIKNALLTKTFVEELPFTKKPYPSVIESTELNDITLAEGVNLERSDLVAAGLVYLTMFTETPDDVVGTILRRIALSMQV
jgi:cell division protein FtsA